MWRRRSGRRDSGSAGEAAPVPMAPDELLHRAGSAGRAEDFGSAVELYERLLDLEPFPFDEATRVWVLRQVAEHRCQMGQPETAAPVAERAVRVAGEVDAAALTGALTTAGFVAWRRGDLPAGRAALEGALGLARRQVENGDLLGPVLLNLARVRFDEGGWEDGRALVDELLTLPVTTPDALLYGCLMAQGWASERGDFDGAWQLAETAWRILIQKPEVPRNHLVEALAARCSAALDLGDVERARAAAAHSLELVRGGARAATAEMAAAEVASEEEAWPLAATHLQRALSTAPTSIAMQQVQLRMAQNRLDGGDHERAELLASELADVKDLDEELAAGLQGVEGRLHHARGDFVAARASFQAACEAFQRMGRRSSAAEICLELGLVEHELDHAENAARQLALAQPLSHRPSIQKLRARLAISVDESKGTSRDP